jgi:hypothetical protein
MCEKKGFFLPVLVLVFISTNVAASGTAKGSSKFQSTYDRIIKAYEYILSRYNATLGLISESEDEGMNAAGGTSVVLLVLFLNFCFFF